MQPDQPLSMTMRLQTRLLWNNSINQSQLINLKIRRDIIVGAVWLNIKKRVSTILGLDSDPKNPGPEPGSDRFWLKGKPG
jgi:hypothetical protein